VFSPATPMLLLVFSPTTSNPNASLILVRMLKAITVHFAAACTAVQVSDTTMPGVARMPVKKNPVYFFQGGKDNK
jgi:hypothetical protein